MWRVDKGDKYAPIYGSLISVRCWNQSGEKLRTERDYLERGSDDRTAWLGTWYRALRRLHPGVGAVKSKCQGAVPGKVRYALLENPTWLNGPGHVWCRRPLQVRDERLKSEVVAPVGCNWRSTFKGSTVT